MTTQPDSLVCNHCFKRFSNSSHLSRHYKIHLGVKEYKCPIPECFSVFIRRDNMKSHYKNHLVKMGLDDDEISNLLKVIPRLEKKSRYARGSEMDSDSSNHMNDGLIFPFRDKLNTHESIHTQFISPISSSPTDKYQLLLNSDSTNSNSNSNSDCNNPGCCLHGSKSVPVSLGSQGPVPLGNEVFNKYLVEMFLSGKKIPDRLINPLLPPRSLTPDPLWSRSL